jgi:NAD(P)-dependent dehydrogenase (short-subunit alcohol dehydrogenase family)
MSRTWCRARVMALPAGRGPAVHAAEHVQISRPYAARGIRVNAVSPGIIQTPAHPVESYAGLGARLPVGHVGQVSDIIGAIIFLESSPFITGEILHVDGGQIAGH